MLKAQLQQVLQLYLMSDLPWRPGKATDLRERCQNIRTIQELLGHKNANS
jgi:site-specific recombinase XerC